MYQVKLFIYIFLLLLSANTLDYDCGFRQKERKDTHGQTICCHTVKCNTHQGFRLCKTNQGSDSCYDCGEKEFTTNIINTADVNEEESVCQNNPEGPEPWYLDRIKYHCYNIWTYCLQAALIIALLLGIFVFIFTIGMAILQWVCLQGRSGDRVNSDEILEKLYWRLNTMETRRDENKYELDHTVLGPPIKADQNGGSIETQDLKRLEGRFRDRVNHEIKAFPYDDIPNRRLTNDAENILYKYFRKDDCCNELPCALNIFNMMVVWTLLDDKKHQYWVKYLETWIESKYSDTISEVPCRYILNKFNCNTDFHIVVDLTYLIERALSVQKRRVAKSMAWKIVRLFVKYNLKPYLKFQDIWPGLEWCKTFTIVVEVQKELQTREKPFCHYFFGIPVKYFGSRGFSPEARSIVERINSIDTSYIDILTIKGICGKEAEDLFSSHRNLTVISKSPLKSRRFKGRYHEISKQPCIQLYCRVKRIIPVGESPFPKSIMGIPTDVIEGYSEFGVKTVEIGNDVGFTNGNNGTLGGFIKYRADDAFLTCAHVVFKREHLAPGADLSFINHEKISIKCKNNSGEEPFVCGTYVDHRFPPKGTQDGVSIDAAIVKLCDDCRPKLATDTVTYNYLHDSVLDYREIGTDSKMNIHAVGAISRTPQKEDKFKMVEDPIMVEFQSLSNVVQASLPSIAQSGMTDNTHIRNVIYQAGETENKIPRQVQLFGQIAFHQIDFKPGDSGMCIYAKDQTGRQGCIGMAIASHPSGGCIVTPMRSILTSMNIPFKTA